MKKYPVLILSFILLLSATTFAQIRTKSDVERALASSNSQKTSTLRTSATEYSVKNSYTDEQLGLDYVYLNQTYKGIIVYNIVQSLVFKNSQLQYSSGKFYTDIATKAPSATPAITAPSAINKAATHLGLAKATSLTEVSNTFTTDKKIVYSDGGIAKQNINTELVWVSNDGGKTIHLAWNVQIEPVKRSDYWHVRVDAATGAIINKGNYTVYENNNTINTKKSVKKNYANIQSLTCEDAINNSQSLTRVFAPPPPPTVTTASYNVIPYPAENPFVTGPTVETNPWTKAGTTNNATTYGWHFDGKTNYNITRGNNVYAYDDSLNKNVPGRSDTSTTAIPGLTFNFAAEPAKDPTTTSNRKFATTNLFYWNNIMHDVFYQYGFTEAAGNFQYNNIARGGVQKDYVLSEAQDGSGTDNSNFSALPDGQTARMQMFLFNSNTTTGNNVTVSVPAAIAGNYTYVESGFSTANKLSSVGSVNGTVVLYNDDATGVTHIACAGSPVNNLAGKIALIYRGTCNFIVKVKYAQTAGAIGVIMVNNINTAPIIMGGTDNTITIPAVMLTDVDGAKLADQLKAGQSVSATINASSAGPRFDGDLDNGVITHEYTHGISLRLTGGPSTTSCLGNAEQGGEGWSDYVALMMTTNWKTAQLTDGAKKRPLGSYVEYQNPLYSAYGIRTYPYSTDTSIDPHTYADLADTTYAGEVHYIGEVWGSALWDMTWNIINQEGVINPNLYDVTSGSGGNNKALLLVIQGLKLQPCSPGFLDARNAILAADSILYKNAHKCAIWKAFAGRGMGFSAKQGSSDTTGDEIAAYDVPPCALPLTLINFSGSIVNNKVALKWTTAAEVNAKEFVVEYATNGSDFAGFTTVATKNTAGVNEYITHHYQPTDGDNYYRLKIVDKDGSFKYSPIVVVKFAGKSGFSVYPNPVKETLTAELFKTQSEKVAVQITDITGRILHQQQTQLQAGNNTIQVNTSKLSKGTYLIMVVGSTKEVKQFVKE